MHQIFRKLLMMLLIVLNELVLLVIISVLTRSFSHPMDSGERLVMRVLLYLQILQSWILFLLHKSSRHFTLHHSRLQHSRNITRSPIQMHTVLGVMRLQVLICLQNLNEKLSRYHQLFGYGIAILSLVLIQHIHFVSFLRTLAHSSLQATIKFVSLSFWYERKYYQVLISVNLQKYKRVKKT